MLIQRRRRGAPRTLSTQAPAHACLRPTLAVSCPQPHPLSPPSEFRCTDVLLAPVHPRPAPLSKAMLASSIVAFVLRPSVLVPCSSPAGFAHFVLCWPHAAPCGTAPPTGHRSDRHEVALFARGCMRRRGRRGVWANGPQRWISPSSVARAGWRRLRLGDVQDHIRHQQLDPGGHMEGGEDRRRGRPGDGRGGLFRWQFDAGRHAATVGDAGRLSAQHRAGALTVAIAASYHD